MAMNFVIIPALIGPLLGPTVGGLIVHWLSWREIFFVNVPVGLAALLLIHRHMPDYRGDAPRPLDLVGLVLFGSGTALLSWLLEIFGEHDLDVTSAAILLLLSISLLAAYGWHSRQTSYPLLRLGLFRVRTFRVSTVGGFITRLGVGRTSISAAPSLPARPGLACLAVGPADDAHGRRRHGDEAHLRAGAEALWLPAGADREYGDDRAHHHCFLPGDPGYADPADRPVGTGAGLFQLAAIFQHELDGLCGHRRLPTRAWPAPSPARCNRCR